MASRAIVMRHSLKKPKTTDDSMSTKYKGITENGVKLASDDAAGRVIEALQDTPKNSIYFLSGVSEEVRTASTARAVVDGIKAKLAGNANYLVLTEEDIWGGKVESTRTDGMIYHGKDFMKRLSEIAGREENKDKRIVVAAPMFTKELSMRRKGWANPDGTHSAYTLRLMELNDQKEEKAFVYWLKHKGKDVNDKDGNALDGPKPEQVANAYAQGIDRLENQVARYIRNRPILIGTAAHSWDVDAFLAKAAYGKASLDAFKKISGDGTFIKETEFGTVKVDKGVFSVNYRGRTYQRKLEKIVGAFALIGALGTLLSTSGITGNVVGVSNNAPLGVFFVFIFLIAVVTYVAMKSSKE